MDLLNSSLEALSGTDEEEYHAARRLFRAAVNLGLMSHLTNPSEEKLGLVQQGRALSYHYGKGHDSMVDALKAAAD